MSIFKILTAKEVSDETKLEGVAEIVANAREAYGNADKKVPSVDVNTAYGATSFDALLAESKVQLLTNEVQKIRAMAVEFARHQPGANVNKKIEELIATNSMFCNIEDKSDMSYL